MKKATREAAQAPFMQIRKTDENRHEFWWAKDLARLLGYEKYSDFLPVIQRAKAACTNSGYNADDHFQDALEVRPAGNGSRRKFQSVRFSRYACYLAIINADPSKEAVAMGQTYLVAQLRALELQQSEAYHKLRSEALKRMYLRDELAKENLALAALARRCGVVAPEDFAIFHNHGYMGLYAGLDARAIRDGKGLPEGENILDHMSSEELSANLLRVKQAQLLLHPGKIKGAAKAGEAHFAAGQKVRQTIIRMGGTAPEDLPAAEDIRQLEHLAARDKK